MAKKSGRILEKGQNGSNMDRSGLNSEELLGQVAAGNSAASMEVFDRYVKRLMALVRTRMSAKLQRRADPEDIVQSAYRSFFLHAQSEEYVWRRSGDLWRLLAGITLHKLYGQIEWHSAARRDMAKEESKGASTNATEFTPVDREPTPDVAVALTEQLQQVLSKLTPTARLVLGSRLQGQTIDEIGRDLGRSQRTVRRLLAQAERSIEQLAHDQ